MMRWDLRGRIIYVYKYLVLELRLSLVHLITCYVKKPILLLACKRLLGFLITLQAAFDEQNKSSFSDLCVHQKFAD